MAASQEDKKAYSKQLASIRTQISKANSKLEDLHEFGFDRPEYNRECARLEGAITDWEGKRAALHAQHGGASYEHHMETREAVYQDGQETRDEIRELHALIQGRQPRRMPGSHQQLVQTPVPVENPIVALRALATAYPWVQCQTKSAQIQAWKQPCFVHWPAQANGLKTLRQRLNVLKTAVDCHLLKDSESATKASRLVAEGDGWLLDWKSSEKTESLLSTGLPVYWRRALWDWLVDEKEPDVKGCAPDLPPSEAALRAAKEPVQREADPNVATAPPAPDVAAAAGSGQSSGSCATPSAPAQAKRARDVRKAKKAKRARGAPVAQASVPGNEQDGEAQAKASGEITDLDPSDDE